MPSQHPNPENNNNNHGEKQTSSAANRRHRNRVGRPARTELGRRPGRDTTQRMIMSSSVSASASSSSSTPAGPPGLESSPTSPPNSNQHQTSPLHQAPAPALAPTTPAADQDDSITDEYRLLLSPMFRAMTKITEHLFLTGVGGMTRANFARNHIDFVVNITLEAPFWEKTQSMRLPLEDEVSTNILPYLDMAVDHIQEAIVKRNAHVLVHCIAGVSRSATVVIAYLMKYKRMDLRSAFNYCYNLRPVIRPNNGFMQQLIAYEQQLFGRSTVWMSEVDVDGTRVRVPQFFVEEHPRLVILEMMRVRAMARTPPVGSGGSGTGATTTNTTTATNSNTNTTNSNIHHHHNNSINQNNNSNNNNGAPPPPSPGPANQSQNPPNTRPPADER